MRIRDRVAIVTGGAMGIGQGVCTRLAEEGGKIAIFDTDLEAARSTVAEIEKTGSSAMALKVDVRSAAEVEAAVKEVISSFGCVDILVNNAGISTQSTIAEMPEEMWDDMIDVNLKGVFLCSRAVAPHMQERRYGKIVSMASQLAVTGRAQFVHYSSAKAAVVAFTRGLATELGPHNINVNAIAPGLIETPMSSRDVPQSLREIVLKRTPMRRFGTPEDIANAVLFFVSAESSFVTGQCLLVCGGSSAAG
jgi:3-oxoacyl-[acyl-carrier protein] reductase